MYAALFLYLDAKGLAALWREGLPAERIRWINQSAEADQIVEVAIIALEDDQKLRWALAAAPSIAFYRYQVSFRLVKG